MIARMAALTLPGGGHLPWLPIDGHIPLLRAGHGGADGSHLAKFGHDIWWIMLIKVVGVFAFLMVFTLFVIWFERRAVSWMQMRVGPNRCGPQGLLQSLADGIKLMLKEDIVPKAADKIVFVMAPVISAT